MEEEKISCIGCKRLFQHSGILRHLSSESAKDCKASYTDEALESLKRASRKRRNQLDTERKFKKQQKLLSSKNESDVTSTDHKVSCKVCKRKFLESGILKHISNTENCKLKYPKKDLSKLKTSSNSRNKMKDKARKCEVYDPDLRSEEYPKNRDKIILASKVCGPMREYVRGGGNQFGTKNITEALEGSLKRLKTDYIDLYQLHWPERSTNFFGRRDYSYNNRESEWQQLHSNANPEIGISILP